MINTSVWQLYANIFYRPSEHHKIINETAIYRHPNPEPPHVKMRSPFSLIKLCQTLMTVYKQFRPGLAVGDMTRGDR